MLAGDPDNGEALWGLGRTVGDLGNLYAEGRYGLPRDEAEAARWKRVRAQTGDDEALGWLAYHGYSIEPE